MEGFHTSLSEDSQVNLSLWKDKMHVNSLLVIYVRGNKMNLLYWSVHHSQDQSTLLMKNTCQDDSFTE